MSKMSFEFAFLHKFLTIKARRLFKVRSRVCREIIYYIRNTDVKNKLDNEIREIRSILEIPKLKIKDDEYFYCLDGKNELKGSKWIDNISEDEEINLNNEIYNLIDKHNFPIFFFDWLKDWILYAKIPEYDVKYGYSLIDHLEEIFSRKVKLLLEEKKYLKLYIKRLIGISKRPKKELTEVYSRIIKSIDQLPTLNIRSFKSFETAIETLQLNKEREDFDDEIIDRRIHYDYLACQIDPDESYKGGDKKLVVVLRKQRERILKRIEKLTNIKIK